MTPMLHVLDVLTDLIYHTLPSEKKSVNECIILLLCEWTVNSFMNNRYLCCMKSLGSHIKKHAWSFYYINIIIFIMFHRIEHNVRLKICTYQQLLKKDHDWVHRIWYNVSQWTTFFFIFGRITYSWLLIDNIFISYLRNTLHSRVNWMKISQFINNHHMDTVGELQVNIFTPGVCFSYIF